MQKNNFLNLELKPADKIIIPKSKFGIVQHHGIYLGMDRSSQAVFSENNYTNGVQIVTATDFFKNINSITEIIRFNGSEKQRLDAVKRAMSMKGNEYNLLKFNCEHYCNIIQHGVSKSNQVKNFLMLILAIIIGFILIHKQYE